MDANVEKDNLERTQQELSLYGDNQKEIVRAAVGQFHLMDYELGSNNALYVVMNALYQAAAQNGWGFVQNNPEAFGLVANPQA